MPRLRWRRPRKAGRNSRMPSMSQPESARSAPPISVTRLRFGVRRSPARCVMSAARTNSEFAIDAAAGSGVQNQKSRQG
jgi:hypothetical protein